MGNSLLAAGQAVRVFRRVTQQKAPPSTSAKHPVCCSPVLTGKMQKFFIKQSKTQYKKNEHKAASPHRNFHFPGVSLNMYSKICSQPRLPGRTPSRLSIASLTTAPAFSNSGSSNPSLSPGHARTCAVRRGTTFLPLCSEKQLPSVTPEASLLSRLRSRHSVLGAWEARRTTLPFATVKLNPVAILATTSSPKGCSWQWRSTITHSPFPATHCCRSRTTAKAQLSHRDMDSTAPKPLGAAVFVYAKCVSTAHHNSQSHRGRVNKLRGPCQTQFLSVNTGWKSTSG